MQPSPKDAPRRFYLVSALMVLCAAACGLGTVDKATLATASSNTSQAPSHASGTQPSTPTTQQPDTTNNAPAPTVSPTPSPASPNGTTPAAPATPKSPTPATFTGTVQHTGLTPTSAIFAKVVNADGSQTLAVKISDQADDCTQVTNNAHHANSNSFWLRAVGPTFANSAFELAPQNTDNTTSTATFYALDSTCSDALSTAASWATAGSLNFTAVSAQTALGTFRASIGSQNDMVSGTFSATACPALATLITAPATPRTCQ